MFVESLELLRGLGRMVRNGDMRRVFVGLLLRVSIVDTNVKWILMWLDRVPVSR